MVRSYNLENLTYTQSDQWSWNVWIPNHEAHLYPNVMYICWARTVRTHCNSLGASLVFDVRAFDLLQLSSAKSCDLGVENPVQIMAGTGSSMLYSFLLFIIILSLQEMYRAKLASSELFTILGGLISSLIFLVLLTFIGNFQESCGMRTGWGAVLLAESVALVAASTVHRVCITTCFLFSAGLLYEVNKLSGMMLQKNEAKVKRH